MHSSTSALFKFYRFNTSSSREQTSPFIQDNRLHTSFKAQRNSFVSRTEWRNYPLYTLSRLQKHIAMPRIGPSDGFKPIVHTTLEHILYYSYNLLNLSFDACARSNTFRCLEVALEAPKCSRGQHCSPLHVHSPLFTVLRNLQ